MTPTDPFRVLFVCMGNICRSPAAEGILRTLVADAGLEDKIDIASAGTHAFRPGGPADSRTAAVAEARGIDLSDHRARRADESDFFVYDMIIALDHSNRDDLRALAPREHRDKVSLLLDWSSESRGEGVPDPYMGHDGFERVHDLVETGCRGLLVEIAHRLRR